MKARATAILLAGLSLLAVAALPLSALAASGILQATDTPPATVESCLTLPPEDQSDCFGTKAAIGEQQSQTQDVIGLTVTAAAIEEIIQSTLQAGRSTAGPEPTAAPASPTPAGIVVPVGGTTLELNLLSLIGLGVCAVGGIVLVALGIYLVRSSGRGDEESLPPIPARSGAGASSGVRPIAAEADRPYGQTAATGYGAMSAAEALASTAPVRAVSLAPPPADISLAEHRLQAAAAPGTQPVLVATDGAQVRVLSADFSIGRAFENDFVVDARFSGYDNVSAEHARLVQDSSQRWLVEDLGSANGTYVNGRPTTMNVLQDGWRVGFGPVEFTFRLVTPEENR